MKTTDQGGTPIPPLDLLWRIHDRLKLIDALALACLTTESSEAPMRPAAAEGIWQIMLDFEDYREAVEAWHEKERGGAS